MGVFRFVANALFPLPLRRTSVHKNLDAQRRADYTDYPGPALDR